MVTDEGSQVVVIGGLKVNELNGDGLPFTVDDVSQKSLLANTMWRLRLPALTTVERTTLPFLRSGDAVFDTDDGRFEANDGMDWLALVGRVGKVVDVDDGTETIGPVFLVHSGGPGMYRVSVYARTTVAGDPSDQMALELEWNDGSLQNAQLFVLQLSSTSQQEDREAQVYLAAAQNLSYTATVSKTGTPHFMLRIRVEKL